MVDLVGALVCLGGSWRTVGEGGREDGVTGRSMEEVWELIG